MLFKNRIQLEDVHVVGFGAETINQPVDQYLISRSLNLTVVQFAISVQGRDSEH